jgi:large repetitive protein
VVSGETGEAVEGVTVEWRFKDEQDVIATTRTNSLGRTEYRYTPDTAGTKEILADITQDNQGVVMTERFEVTALSRNEWTQETTLYLNEKPVDLSKGDLELLSDESYELKLEVNSGSVLIGSSVMLEDLSDAETLGLKFDPPLSEPQPLKEGQPVSWDITCDPDKTGYFALKLIGQKLPDWYLPGLVIAKNPNEDVEVYLDTSSMLFGGKPAYPCIGATHTLTVKPKDHSSLLGKYVTLEVTEEAAGLGVSVRPDPSIPQKLEVRGMYWTLSCVNSTKSGAFSVRLKVLEWDFSSLPLSMSLGHNKVKVIDRDGPREIGGTGGRWRTGVCVASEFTKQVVAVPVTVCISDNPSERSTDSDGWIYVFHEKEESVTFTLHNLYDGSTAGQ